MKLKSILLFSASVAFCGQLFAQSVVSTNGYKYSLIEEATGQWCGWCPDGAQVIEQAIEPIHPHAVIASWHGPSAYGEPMTVAGDPFTTNSGFIPGFPDGTVNRNSTWAPGGIVQDRGQWVNDIISDSTAGSPNFDVTIKAYHVLDTVHIVVVAKALKALTGTWSINALMSEDSISSAPAAYNQHSYLWPAGTMSADGSASWFAGVCSGPCPSYTTCDTCGIITASHYYHMNVVRAILGTTMWGNLAFTNPAINTTKSDTFTYIVPGTSVLNNMKVIAMVENLDPTMSTTPLYSGMPNYYTKRVIENAIWAKVKLMSTGPGVLSAPVFNTAALENVALFPNPATTTINVQYTMENPAKTNISISNSAGQVLIEKEFTPASSQFSENIAINNLPNGVYFMNISAAGATVAKQFTVAR